MSDSKQLLILKAFTLHLEGMNPTAIDPGTEDNYLIDMRAKVVRGRTTLGAAEDDSPPVLSFLEKPSPEVGIPAGEQGVRRLENWTLLLQGFAPDDKKNPTDPAYLLKAQVEQRLSQIIEIDPSTGDPVFPDVYLLGSLIIGLTIGQGVVRPPDKQVSPTAFFYLPLIVKMKTDVSKPYSTK